MASVRTVPQMLIFISRSRPLENSAKVKQEYCYQLKMEEHVSGRWDPSAAGTVIDKRISSLGFTAQTKRILSRTKRDSANRTEGPGSIHLSYPIFPSLCDDGLLAVIDSEEISVCAGFARGRNDGRMSRP